MADLKTRVINHNEISTLAATKLGKGYTPEGVAKTVETYSQSMTELMEENAPKSKGEKVIVQTPIAVMEVSYEGKELTIANDDGTTYKMSGSNKISFGASKLIIEAVNRGFEKVIGKKSAEKRAA